MKRPGLSVAAMALVAVIVCGGCRRGSGTVMIQDPGPEHRQEALRLAGEAEKAEKSGDKARAIRLYEQSLEHSHDFAVVYHNLGMLYADRGERGDQMAAVNNLQEAVLLEPNRAATLYCIGYIYERNHQPEKALDYFKQALAKDKRYLPALRGVAKVGKETFAADRESLEWMKTALLIETNPEWRKVFEEEKTRIDGALQNLGSAGKF